MTEPTTLTASDLYARIATAFVADPDLESRLLDDLEGTMLQRFGVKLPKPATLVPTHDGFRLTYDGETYDLGDPRTARPGELNDAELELVSGGGDVNCEIRKMTESKGYPDPTANARGRPLL